MTERGIKRPLKRKTEPGQGNGTALIVAMTGSACSSLRIHTEMGFLILSESFNANVRRALEADFDGTNAWQLERRDDGRLYRVSDEQTPDSQPAYSTMQRLEDWFLSHMPIEGDMQAASPGRRRSDGPCAGTPWLRLRLPDR